MVAQTPLAAPALDELVRLARAVIAGIEEPPALVPTPAVLADIERRQQRERERGFPPLPATVVQRLSNDLALQDRYGGRPVVCFETADGRVAVLACGLAEIDALLGGLDASEQARVSVRFPDAPLAFVPVELAAA